MAGRLGVDGESGRVVIGCVGSRDLPADAAAACRRIGAELVAGGFALATGATPGAPGRDPWAAWADGAFAYGAAGVDPAALTVCLPWRHFPRGGGAPPPGVTARYTAERPRWGEAAAAFWAATHDAGEGEWRAAVPRAARLRHERDVGVVLAARLVLAWPHGDAVGTRFAMRFAAWSGVPLLDLSQLAWWTVVPALVARLRADAASPAALDLDPG